MRHRNNYPNQKFLYLFFLALMLSGIQWVNAQTVRYVSNYAPAAGNNSGSSWYNACNNLQAMINASAPGDQVWVAGGTYKPTTGSSRTVSFTMKNGVAIYGGFNGMETLLSQRNFITNVTILSGDLNGDDVITGSGPTLNITGNTENCYHVVNNTFTSINPLVASAVLDGFTVKGGASDYSNLGDASGTGMLNLHASPTLNNIIFTGNYAGTLNSGAGGGLFNSLNSSPALTNVTFLLNYAQSDGGGMYNYTSCNPTLVNVLFKGNMSYGTGGAISSIGDTIALNHCSFMGNGASNGGALSFIGSNATFSGCSFMNNTSFHNSGGLWIENSTAGFTNCLFSGNVASLYGGAIHNRNSTVSLNNTTLFNNTAGATSPYNATGVMAIDGAAPVTTMKNCILWGNQSLFNNNNPVISNSIVQGGWSGSGNLSADPQFSNPANPPGADGIAATSDDGLQLLSCSPGLNSGDNSGVSATDLIGNPRIYNAYVDMGPYEFQSFPQPLLSLPPTTNNNCLNFDGVNDTVAIIRSCGSGTPLVNGGNAITIEYWFKGTNAQSAVRLQPDGVSYIVAAHQNSMHILSNDGGIAGVSAGSGFTDGNWHHMAFTWQRNTSNGFKSYLDGQLVDQRNSSDNPLPVIDNGMYLGGLFGNQQMMQGSLEEVRIWEVARTQAQIQGGMCGVTLPQSGLRLYYKFDHGAAAGSNTSITTLANSVENQFNGQLSNFLLTGTSSNWLTGNGSGSTWYLDADNDGYYTGSGILQCTSPGPGYKDTGLLGGGDCNDANPAVHPGATEICNGIDDNCDGQIDEGSVCCASGILYVKAGATGLGTGSSWADAFTSLQNALASACSGVTQIWVAAGTYKPTTGTDRGITFPMRNNLAIYGGFSGTETSLSQRNPDANVTILSGDIGVENDNSDNSYNLIANIYGGLNNSALLDGFTITLANSGGYGGGVHVEGSSPAFYNCRFVSNSANVGGGIFAENCSTKIVNCTFAANNAEFGSAICCGIYSNLAITNCSFSGNTFGSAVLSYSNTNTTITNCIFWQNDSQIGNANIGTNTSVTYSIVQGGYGGTGNLNVDPLFFSPTDLRLQPCSPGIDAGNDAAVTAVTDLTGSPRKVESIAGGSLVDMGAFEYQYTVSAPQNWYLDADNDGYFTGAAVFTCGPPSAGYRSSGLIAGGDCNDANSAIFPGATEVANGMDDNCNGQTDEGTTVSPVILVSGPTTFCSGGSVDLTVATGDNAIQLNGIDQYLITPDLKSYFSSTSMTVEVWFRAESAGVIVTELGQAAINSGYHDSQIEILSSGHVMVRVWPLGSVDLGVVTFGTWHHAVVRYNEGTQIMDGLLDGVPSASIVTGVKQSWTGQFWAFGPTESTNLGSGAWLNGQVDEIRIWNMAISNAQILQNYQHPVAPNAAGLVAYYKADETTGATALDATSFANNGTLYNNPARVIPSGKPLNGSVLWSNGATSRTLHVTSSGNYTATVTVSPSCSGTSTATAVTVIPVINAPPVTTANALNFDGVNDHVYISTCGASTPIVNGGNAITIEYWFKGSSNQSAVRMQPDGSTFIMSGWSNLHVLSNDGGIANGLAVGDGYNDGNWHHLALTWQRNTVNGFKSYLDGQLIAQRNSADNPLPVINSGIYLGSNNGTSDFMGGSLDEVRIWSVARSQADIQAGICSFTLPQTGLVAYYSFDHGSAGNANPGVGTLANLAQPGIFNGKLNNFALNGPASNWVPGKISEGIDIQGGSPAISIASGDMTPAASDGTDFGGVTNSLAHTFTIRNTGAVSMVLSGISVSGSDASLFTVGAITPASTVPGHASAAFTLTFAPNSVGLKTALVHISYGGCTLGEFTFAIQGTGLCAIPPAVNRSVNNVTIPGVASYEATNTVTVAGAGLPVSVVAGGNATFLAGVKISFLQGTTVQAGGYMHGYIETGTICGSMAPAAPAAPVSFTGEAENLPEAGGSRFTLYPNPTIGNFTLAQKGSSLFGMVDFEVYSIGGEKVMSDRMIGEKQHEYNISAILSGVYFVKITAKNYTETIKLVLIR